MGPMLPRLCEGNHKRSRNCALGRKSSIGRGMKYRTLRSLGAAAAISFIVWPCASLAQTAAAAQVAAGERVYSDYCSNCHGEGLRNTSGGVTFDLRRLRSEDRDRFVGAVLDGKRQMPPWRGALDMEQIESIWAYIRATVDRPNQ